MPGATLLTKTPVTRRHFLTGAAASAAALALYSGEIARHELSIHTPTIPIRNLPPPFHGYRILQISDIHFDEYTEPAFLHHVISEINRLAPALVLLTGDFVSKGHLAVTLAQRAAFQCAEILATIQCPLRYAVLGNHDVSVSALVVTQALRSNGIPVLINQHIPIEREGSRLWICGAEDPGTSHPNLFLTIPPRPDGPVLLLIHEPDFIDLALQHPRGHLVDLALAGHTHGGQVRLPILGALVLPPMGRKYVEGLFQLNQLQLYVNRGIGTVGVPLRLNCPPELTLLTLQPV